MNGVTFGTKHSLTNYGLIFNSRTISEPEAQKTTVAIPGRNGSIDLSEVLTGNVRYNDRVISIDFTITANVGRWEKVRETLANDLHGSKMKIIFDDDANYYWYGRISVGDISPDGPIATITITAVVDPYKYNITSSAEDWLWDPFDFDSGVINETKNIVVSGTKDVSIICTGKVKNPIFTSTGGNLTVKIDGGTAYPVFAGTNVNYNIALTAGTHTLTFTGTGTVSVDYVGGSL